MNKPFRSIPRVANQGQDVQAIITNMEVGLGRGLDAWLTKRDLVDAGLLNVTRLNRPGGGDYVINPQPGGNVETPTKPTNFQAQGAFTHVILSWDIPTYNGHAYTEIYRSSTDNFGTAILIQTSVAPVAADTVDYGSQYYYWVRHVNTNNVRGPLHDTAGEYAETAPNVSAVIEELSDELNETHLAQHLRDRIDLIDTPITGLVDQVAALTVATDIQIFFQASAPAGPLANNSRWFDTDDDNHPYIWVDGAWEDARDQLIDFVQTNLTQEIIDRTDADTAQISRLDSLEATVFDAETGVAANATATQLLDSRVTVTEGNITANAGDITSLQSTVFNPSTGVGANATAISGITTQITGIDGELSSVASSVTLLTSEVGDNSAAISVIATTVDGLDAQWSVKTQVGDLVGGIGLYNDGVTTYFMVNADVFAILDNEGDDINPFFVQDNTVYINTAMIADASISVAKIEDLTVEDITGFNSAFVLSTIGTGNITNAYIGQFIQSNNYSAGNAGWRIDKNGNMEVHSISIYDNGDLIMSSGTPVVNSINPINPANVSTYMQAAAIDTLYVAGQAISVIEAAETGFDFIPGWSGSSLLTTPLDCASRSISVTNYLSTSAILIYISYHFFIWTSGSGIGSAKFYVRISRNSTIIKEIEIFSNDDVSALSAENSFFVLDDPGANGSYTYSIDIIGERDDTDVVLISGFVNSTQLTVQYAKR